MMILAYTSIGLHLFKERMAYFREPDGVRMIGLKMTVSLLLLIYDMYVCSFVLALTPLKLFFFLLSRRFINLTLLLIFLWPLLHTRVRNLYLRSITIRAVYATFLMLCSSTVNIVIFTAIGGREVGWVCLASCGADVRPLFLCSY